MIPGLNGEMESLLLKLLDPRVTSLTPGALQALDCTILTPSDPELADIGVHATGSPDLVVALTHPERKVGRLQVAAIGAGGFLFLDNRHASGQLFGNIRMLGGGCAVLFAGLGTGYIALQDLFLRSDGQLVLWCPEATAVGVSVELEGEGRCLVVGDDALLSAGIWIRNHDMHAIHDLATGERIDRTPVDTILERHVWIGQSATLQGCERIGAGSIVGAHSLAKGLVPGCTVVAGVPVRILREGTSWGRSLAGMTGAERAMLGLPETPDGGMIAT